jgi:hypothetical protein
MMAVALPLAFQDWRSRILSFNNGLILLASLTLAKGTLLVADLQDSEDPPRQIEISQQDPVLETPDPVTPKDEDFVPWPTVLPEPAAGPEQDDSAPAMPFGDPELVFDPSSLTEGQVLALQQLSARRQQLEEREQLLDMRAEVNARTESRLDEQIKQLMELKNRIETLMTDLDEAEELKIARLVKIYETMKPKAAAEIFNRLDMTVLLHVVERMKESKSAVVLGKMDPAIAKSVTTELARRKERPDLGG